ncbi:carbon monoxide dehydrogenase subunit G (CoxG) family protein [Streptomyces hygroscopicus subsp. sporocinereus]|uniref:Carbon monoxide dehydrogenase subunit G (CoxG) family protein n=1 Tax=Streptomyces hygroscopicus TaxID=1912 RepID=A0ABQ3TRL4_STRHY|nr:SRPBCC family protein [Streptomyces hygroscopicus]GHJ25974.1 carbon monoxide dehydrogenase subunit G (CoxG) family protein [Streptomyces hygroscopicus]
MQLIHTVSVKAEPDAVFALLSDVGKVASCMPGAALEGRDGDAWRGAVKVKVGPISAAYTGTVRFLEVDAEKRRLRVHASGADTHGSGDAEAEVSLEVVPAEDGARLNLSTDLVIRGKIAQFGKGAIGAVSDRILQQFAQNLGSLLLQPDGGQAPATTAGAAPAASAPAAGAPAEAPGELNGMVLIAGPLLKKYGPVAAAFLFGLSQGWLLGRRR